MGSNLIFNEYLESKTIKNGNCLITHTSLSKGKYFIRLDADDWFEKNAIKYMVKTFENNNKYEIVFGNYYFVNEEGVRLGIDKKYD